jgi:hypothetical protein
LISYPSFLVCSNCTQIVVERRITRGNKRKLIIFFFNFFHVLMSAYACRFLLLMLVLLLDFDLLTSSIGLSRQKEGNKDVGGTKEEPD